MTNEFSVAGYREIEHTADWEIDVWAPEIASLFEQAARGMYALSGVRLDPTPRLERALSIQAADPESMLVAFLSELLYIAEQEQLGFDRYDLSIQGEKLNARLSGAPIQVMEKEIKAVTYHQLAVRPSPRGLEVSLVFDV